MTSSLSELQHKALILQAFKAGLVEPRAVAEVFGLDTDVKFTSGIQGTKPNKVYISEIGKYPYSPPMFPGMKKMPEWMKTAGQRMHDMGVPDDLIAKTLKQMRKTKIRKELEEIRKVREEKRKLKLLGKRRGRACK